jgi:hypothetical protein
MLSKRYACQILMKIEFSWQIFEKVLKHQISWKSVQWERSCSMRKDGRTETHLTKLIGAYRNFVHGSKNLIKSAAFWTSAQKEEQYATASSRKKDMKLWIWRPEQFLTKNSTS